MQAVFKRDDLAYVLKTITSLFSTLSIGRFGAPITFKFRKGRCLVECKHAGASFGAKIDNAGEDTGEFTIQHGLIRKFAFPGAAVSFVVKKRGILCSSGAFSGMLNSETVSEDEYVEDISDLEVHEIDAGALVQCLQSVAFKVASTSPIGVRIISTGLHVEAHSNDDFKGAFCRVPFKGEPYELVMPRVLSDILGESIDPGSGLTKIGSSPLCVYVENSMFKVVYPTMQIASIANVTEYIAPFEAKSAMLDVTAAYGDLADGLQQITAAFRDDAKLTKQISLSLSRAKDATDGVTKQGAKNSKKERGGLALQLKVTTPVGAVRYAVAVKVNRKPQKGDVFMCPDFLREFVAMAGGRGLGMPTKTLREQPVHLLVTDTVTVLSGEGGRFKGAFHNQVN